MVSLQPNDVVQDSARNIYVVDTNNSRIQKFNSSGRLLTKWGSEGTADGQFNNPLGAGYDPTTNESTRHKQPEITGFRCSTPAGTFQSKFGSEGTGNGQFNALEVTFIGGSAYVVDGGNNRIQAFVATTNAYITQWGSTGSANSKFNFVNSIASDSGYLYVSDNDRVQKLRLGGGWTAGAAVSSPTGVALVNHWLLVSKAGSGSVAAYAAPERHTDINHSVVRCLHVR